MNYSDTCVNLSGDLVEIIISYYINYFSSLKLSRHLFKFKTRTTTMQIEVDIQKLIVPTK